MVRTKAKVIAQAEPFEYWTPKCLVFKFFWYWKVRNSYRHCIFIYFQEDKFNLFFWLSVTGNWAKRAGGCRDPVLPLQVLHLFALLRWGRTANVDTLWNSGRRFESHLGWRRKKRSSRSCFCSLSSHRSRTCYFLNWQNLSILFFRDTEVQYRNGHIQTTNTY